MENKDIKVGKLYYHRMYTDQIFCVIDVANTIDIGKTIYVLRLNDEVVLGISKSVFLGSYKVLDQRYWKNNEQDRTWSHIRLGW